MARLPRPSIPAGPAQSGLDTQLEPSSPLKLLPLLGLSVLVLLLIIASFFRRPFRLPNLERLRGKGKGRLGLSGLELLPTSIKAIPISRPSHYAASFNFPPPPNIPSNTESFLPNSSSIDTLYPPLFHKPSSTRRPSLRAPFELASVFTSPPHHSPRRSRTLGGTPIRYPNRLSRPFQSTPSTPYPPLMDLSLSSASNSTSILSSGVCNERLSLGGSPESPALLIPGIPIPIPDDSVILDRPLSSPPKAGGSTTYGDLGLFAPMNYSPTLSPWRSEMALSYPHKRQYSRSLIELVDIDDPENPGIEIVSLPSKRPNNDAITLLQQLPLATGQTIPQILTPITVTRDGQSPTGKIDTGADTVDILEGDQVYSQSQSKKIPHHLFDVHVDHLLLPAVPPELVSAPGVTQTASTWPSSWPVSWDSAPGSPAAGPVVVGVELSAKLDGLIDFGVDLVSQEEEKQVLTPQGLERNWLRRKISQSDEDPFLVPVVGAFEKSDMDRYPHLDPIGHPEQYPSPESILFVGQPGLVWHNDNREASVDAHLASFPSYETQSERTTACTLGTDSQHAELVTEELVDDIRDRDGERLPIEKGEEGAEVEVNTEGSFNASIPFPDLGLLPLPFLVIPSPVVPPPILSVSLLPSDHKPLPSPSSPGIMPQIHQLPGSSPFVLSSSRLPLLSSSTPAKSIAVASTPEAGIDPLDSGFTQKIMGERMQAHSCGTAATPSPASPMWSRRVVEALPLGLPAESFLSSNSVDAVGTDSCLNVENWVLEGEEALVGEEKMGNEFFLEGAGTEPAQAMEPDRDEATRIDEDYGDEGEFPSTPVRGSFPIIATISPTTSMGPVVVPSLTNPTRLRLPRSALDIALAMQLRPGLGPGADPAWMVRFLMSMFGWFVLLISGRLD